MDPYARAILSLTKNIFENTVGVRPYQTGSEARTYYLERLDDNLCKPMEEAAKTAYGRGTGNEIASGKMNALRSSSALTYNLFGNGKANFDPVHSRIGAGSYSVAYEQQYHTLKPSVSGMPANLDAFLYCEDTGEAVACEMKMLEWLLNKPGELRSKYLEPSHYLTEEAGRVFTAVARELLRPEDQNAAAADSFPCRMLRYDAFQMFKHAVACYTACLSEEKRKIRKLTLVNCIWTLPVPEVLEYRHCQRYRQDEACERREFEDFRQVMQPVVKLFGDSGVDFEICLYSFGEFLALMKKKPDEVAYLRRYTL